MWLPLHSWIVSNYFDQKNNAAITCEVGNFSQLQLIYLNSNNLDSSLDWSTPTDTRELGGDLALDSNRLNRHIPVELCQLRRIVILFLHKSSQFCTESVTVTIVLLVVFWCLFMCTLHGLSKGNLFSGSIRLFNIIHFCFDISKLRHDRIIRFCEVVSVFVEQKTWAESFSDNGNKMLQYHTLLFRHL
jgi:hypothetical protein